MTATQTKVKIQPLADRVVLEVMEENQQTAGGLFIPDSAREKPQQGRILAVGPGARVDGKLIEMSVEVGQIVLFAKYGGTDVRIEGCDYKIVAEKDILGIIQA
jgi:chaperonin GroES